MSFKQHKEEYERLTNGSKKSFIDQLDKHISKLTRDVEGKEYPPLYYPNNEETDPHVQKDSYHTETSHCIFRIREESGACVGVIKAPCKTKPIFSHVVYKEGQPWYTIFIPNAFMSSASNEIIRYMDPDEIEIIRYFTRLIPCWFRKYQDSVPDEKINKIQESMHKWFDRYRTYKLLAKNSQKFKDENERLQKENTGLSEKYSTLARSHSLIRHSFENAKNTIDNQSRKILDIKEDNTKLTRKVKTLKSKLEKVKEEKEELAYKVEACLYEFEGFTERINTLTAANEIIVEEKVELTNKVEAFTSENEELVNKVEELEEDKGKVTEENKVIINENKHLLRKIESQDRIIIFLLSIIFTLFLYLL